MTTTINETNPETAGASFKVGDRVRVINLFMESGREGVIESLETRNGDDCMVQLDGYNRCLSYNFKNLVKIEAEVEVEVETEDDEPEDVIEAVAFEAGDIVVIEVPTSHIAALGNWQGLRFRVVSVARNMLFLEDGAIDTRPDGRRGNFYWDIPWLRAFDPTRDFKVGDIVDASRYKSKGVITNPEIFLGGDIEVNWTEGRESLVAYGPIGASRRYLTLIGTERPAPEPEVEPEPEPEPLAVGDRVKVIDARGDWAAELGALGEVVGLGEFDKDLLRVLQDNGVMCSQKRRRFERTDEPKPFVAEVGAKIESSAVLAGLPIGTVVIVNGDERSPIVKLDQDRFGRLNRYGLDGYGYSEALAYFEDEGVASAADSEDSRHSVVIVFVPSESA
jgi:hypothetical protein